MNGGNMMFKKENVNKRVEKENIWPDEVETQPLPTLRALAFQAFLELHALTLLDVALASGVRLLTVWRVARDLPVTFQQAERVRAGLHRLTGARYRGGLTVQVDTQEHISFAEKQKIEGR
jgi:hypothetical protein